MKKNILFSLAITLVAACLTAAQDMPQENKTAFLEQLKEIDAGIEAGPYKADWEDLERHQAAPEWFLDAKLGIYFHWGIYTVTGRHEWHLQKMYIVDRFREFHEKTYGPIDEYPYHKLAEQFDGTHFDAEDWAKLFKESGAKFAGPCAVHHDTFAMWDSKITPWNSANYGPRRDIVGELEKAIKAQGLKFLTTFHNERSQQWIPRLEGSVTVSTDPEMRIRYANYSVEDYGKIFLAELGEVIDEYQPDAIWFDGGMDGIRPDTIHKRFLAYYFNSADKWGRDVMVNTKKHAYPPTISVIDFERGGAKCLTQEPWLSDDFIGSGWMYRKPFQARPTKEILHNFLNVISKNGCLLLNLSPTTDGRITEDQRAVLKELGDWLTVNGEAVYCTRPWLAYGEGPNRVEKKEKGQGLTTLNNLDVRYTRSKDDKAMYVMIMGWNKEFTLKSIKAGSANGRVELLGYGPVEHSLNNERQIQITFPQLSEDKRPCKYAYCFKLTGFNPSLHPAADKNWQLVESNDPGKSKGCVIGLELEDAESTK